MTLTRSRALTCALLGVTLLAAATEVLGEPTPGGLAPGARVRWRIASQGNARQVGGFATARRDTLYLMTPATGETLAVAGADLSRLEISRGRKSHARTGALIGGAISVTLISLFVIQASLDEGMGVGGNEVWSVAAVGLLGAGAGYAVGGLIRTERWERVPEPWSISGSTDSPTFAIRVSRSW